MKSLSFATLIMLLWILLSGHFEPLLLGLGLASTALTVFLSLRMDVVDHEGHPIYLTARLLRFFVFLVREVVLANIDVVKRILTPGKSISPQLFTLPILQRTDLGRVIYANAITLTPGTVTVRLRQSSITVHALSKEAAQDLATERMARAVPEE